MKNVCDKMMNHPHGWNVRHGGDVVDSTGPFLLTDAYKDFTQKELIKVIEPEYLYPIQLGETRNIINNSISEEMSRRINAAYAIHYFSGTWCKNFS